MSSRRHLRSAATPTLVVPATLRSTLGDRAFPVAAARYLELFAVLAARSPVTDDVQTLLEKRTIRFQLYLTVLLHYQHVCF